MAKEIPVAKEAQSWDDKLAAALPQRASFYDAVRTDAYLNKNGVADYIEFWVALQVDKTQDKWRTMHYMIFDLGNDDGKFRSEIASKTDCSFAEAIYHMAEFDAMASRMGANPPCEMTQETFPPEEFPELSVYFFDIEHYKPAAHLEQIAFDTAGRPYRRIEGRVFSTATFTRSEIRASIQASETAHAKKFIEDGILSDMFNAVSGSSASLDNTLKIMQSLASMDDFALQMVNLYLAAQILLGKDDGLSKLENLTQQEKEALDKKIFRNQINIRTDLTKASTALTEAKQIGVHIEPFQKHLAECSLYLHLLSASLELDRMKESLKTPNSFNNTALQTLKDSVTEARTQFSALGGTAEQFDKLQAWVATDKKGTIPPWVTTWIERYYDQRRKVMSRLQNKSSDVRAINTVSAKVKPPLVE